MNILLTGGTGLIGQQLGQALVRLGHTVTVVTRSQSAAVSLSYPARCLVWDLEAKELSAEHLRGIDAIIHLAGENVAQRWTALAKKKILTSRVDGTRNLLANLAESSVQVVVAASAIGIYGDGGEQSFDENAGPGSDFLSDVVVQWENQVNQSVKASKKSIRTVIQRLGVVLSANGGALEKMLLPFQASVGGQIGNGRQWMSWVHIDDVINAFLSALSDQRYQGVYNVVSPFPVTNRSFSIELAQVLKRGLFLPVPQVAMQILYGEMSQVILASTKVLPQRLLQMGFKFRFENIEQALSDLLDGFQDRCFRLQFQQYLPIPRGQLFTYFLNVENLAKITPPDMHFRNVGKVPNPIYAGLEIEHKVRLKGVPMTWRSLIAEINPNESFRDVQLKGPYQKWSHRHAFADLGSGTVLTDDIVYQLPMGALGLIGWFFVKSELNKAFKHRQTMLWKDFNPSF